MVIHLSFLFVAFVFLLAPTRAYGQDDFEPLFDESGVPDYSLPDPLVLDDGTVVAGDETWWSERRPEIFTLFESEVYGRAPAPPDGMRFELTSGDKEALNGMATRKEISIYLTDAERPRLDVLLYVPNAVDRPAPAFLGLNYYGNQSIYPDAGITISDQWMRDASSFGIENHRATPRSRGVRTSRWPVESLLRRGYALATLYYGDVDPDFDDGFRNGVHPLFYDAGQTHPAPDEWGSIAAWAWGLSRALDYLATDSDVDAERVAVIGHSRLGKAALWAGASDPRFALVVSNNSGCGGAALSRRRFGETVERINTSFPHWFADNFNAYNEKEDALPVDQHMLLALIAPRPVYIASAEEDRWADPRGEFLAAKHADPVFRLLGTEGLPVDDMPSVNEPAMGRLGYHIRPGLHDITFYDWERYLEFADRHLSR